MASLLFKEMKGLNFSCTSPASTAAICATIEGRSAISSGMVGGGGRAIDRYNPHLRDPRRSKAAVVKPAVLLPQAPNSKTSKYNINSNKKSKKSSQKPDTNLLSMTSPGSSSRFLLNRDITFSDHVFAEPDHVLSSVVSPPPPPPPSSSLLQLEMISRSHHQSPDRNEPSPSTSSSSSSSAAAVTATATAAAAAAAADITASVKPQNQVVVLRVSLHCKGCEGKVRKHISKMKGVKSFSIDFAAKKVTVIGDVTPLGVLNSISKVKSAQFWPSPGDSQNLL